MRLLILGASGYVGSYLFKAFQKTELNVTGTTHSSPVQDLIKIDFKNITDVINLFDTTEFDVIINTIGHPSPDYCESYPDEAYGGNFTSIFNLISALKNKSNKPFLINLSTIYVYKDESQTNNESSLPCPINTYGYTKLLAELFISRYYEKSISIRLPMILGNPEHPNDFLMTLCKQLQKDEDLELDNSELRYPIDINDLYKVIMKIITTQPKGILNLANNSNGLTRYQMGVIIKENMRNSRGTLKDTGTYPDPQKWLRVALRPRDLKMISCRKDIADISFRTFRQMIEIKYRYYFERSYGQTFK